MYKCAECGFIFEEPAVWTESRGEWFGYPAREEMAGCPRCRGGYDEYYGKIKDGYDEYYDDEEEYEEDVEDDSL